MKKKPKKLQRRQTGGVIRQLCLYDFVQSHEHTYRLFRGLIPTGQTLFNKNAFRTLVISGYFLSESGPPDSTDTLDEQYKVKVFEDSGSAEAFFARVLYEANRENDHPTTGLTQ